MVLHEMVTNPVKYGALSTRRGRIGLSWRVSGDIERLVELVWHEQGGPTVKTCPQAASTEG
jgi:two-component sensor histidine kinase